MPQGGGPETHWRVMGTGPRTALALHCTMAHSGAWRGLADRLGERVTLHAPDMPGHGKSNAYDGLSCTGSLVYEAVLARLEHLDGPVDVIGHSFGGVVALRLAVAHPERVRSLTLYEPVFLALAMTEAVDGFAEHDAMIEQVRAAVARGDTMAGARAFVRDWGDGTAWDQLPERGRQGFAQRIPFVLGSQDYVAFDTPGTQAQLGSIRVPTLILRGGKSPAVIGSVCRALAHRIPGARQITLDTAGHMGAISHATEMAQHMTQMFDGALNRA